MSRTLAAEPFATVRDALFSGFRPCPRCRPMAPSAGAPAWASALLAAVEAEPSRPWKAADLQALGLAPEAVRRWFLKAYGLTFAGWCRALRLGGAFTQLLQDGAEPLSRDFGVPLGGKPASCVLAMTSIPTPLGPMVAAAGDQGLCFLEFADRRMLQAQLRTLARRLKADFAPGDHPHLHLLRRELEAYFAGALRTFTVPLHTPGTPFQEALWHELRHIPCGTTTTYEALAERLGRPTAVRAVGHANGLNRICILVPCHRVLDKDGGLCGYGGGLWRKRLLLGLERTGRLAT
jgi:AraC family transcriptional regulator of adaptative response/methylated-DNA-[protein]-cysteine methyltransferase